MVYMSLSDKIKNAKKYAQFIANYTVDENQKEYVLNYIFQSYLQSIINNDLMNKNPEHLFEKYKKYFQTKQLPTKTIHANEIFLRGRVGNEIFHGALDDCNMNFILPYYQNAIQAPPPIYATGGRFNREGISYLYLADKIETCLAEVHLQIGQNCSVGEFRCTKDIDLIDLTQFTNDFEMKTWLKILTQPVYNGTKYVYNITRFLADVFKSINENGIYFESVQSEGHNIVCYNPSLFELVKYSEKIYCATKIKYDFEQVEDSIRKYSKNEKRKEINAYNADEDEKNQKEIEYLDSWIKYEEQKKQHDVDSDR